MHVWNFWPPNNFPSFWGGSLLKSRDFLNNISVLTKMSGSVGSSWSFRNSSVLPCLSGWQRLANDTQNDIQNWLVVELTHLKNMLVKMGSSSPNFGVNIKKYLSCHHLENDRENPVKKKKREEPFQWSNWKPPPCCVAKGTAQLRLEEMGFFETRPKNPFWTR